MTERLCGCGYRESLHRVDVPGGAYCELARARDERDALAAALPSAGADCALAYSVEKARADRAEAALVLFDAQFARAERAEATLAAIRALAIVRISSIDYLSRVEVLALLDAAPLDPVP